MSLFHDFLISGIWPNCSYYSAEYTIFLASQVSTIPILSGRVGAHLLAASPAAQESAGGPSAGHGAGGALAGAGVLLRRPEGDAPEDGELVERGGEAERESRVGRGATRAPPRPRAHPSPLPSLPGGAGRRVRAAGRDTHVLPLFLGPLLVNKSLLLS